MTGKPEVYPPEREKVQIRAKADRLGCMSQSIFALARAIGATHEAHVISYCRLLPPREIAKSFSANGMVGRGGGDRTEHPSNSH